MAIEAPKKPKYLVQVYEVSRAQRVPKEVVESLKGAVSGKMLAKMKKEAINCPVLGKERPFLVCFECPNFISRLKGVVHCLGEPLPE